MTKIKLTKSNQYGKAGETIEVTGTIAHGIIDRGEGKLSFQGDTVNMTKEPYANRMISNKRNK